MEPLQAFDVQRHNDEVKQVWEAFHKGTPIRTPVAIGCYERCTLNDPLVNPRQIQYEQMFTNFQLMLERQLEHAAWLRTKPWQDAEMGPPRNGWDASPNFVNIYEAAWFGCPLIFIAGQIPDSLPILTEENKHAFLGQGIPDPFESPFGRTAWAAYQHFLAKRQEGWTWQGLPLKDVWPALGGTDGPLTVACNIRGATEFLEDLAADPEFADALLEHITEATIVRVTAIRRACGLPEKAAGFWFADDSCQLISLAMYEERILPHHKRLVAALSDGSPIGVHMCGNATRHFPLICQELNARSFDTGFPVDFGALRRELGPEVLVNGGPSVPFLQQATPDEVRAEVARIGQSGVREGGKFVLREGNNLAPGTPEASLYAMYAAAKEFGVY